MTRPQNVGIKAIEIYVPSEYVSQAELEKYDNVGAGKYTIGLGQTNMAFVNDREDIYSMSLTVLSNLLTKYNIDKSQIGRLEVGTETLLDKSKSVKSVLMQLFDENTDIEGIDTVNACYGGTNAVFNAVNWIQSDSWDGRYAIVVCGDIAIYAKGAARPTGGAGTVAMLIGPDAPIVLEPVHGSYMKHVYDFYKPDFTSEYPVVDGHYSLQCYVDAVDECYKHYSKKAIKKGLTQGLSGKVVGLDFFDYNIFHVPTCKLVSKSYARLSYLDDVALDKATGEYDVKAYSASTKTQFATNVKPSLEFATNVGNIYTASVWSSLASLLTYVGNENVQGKRIGAFSYGSGLAASIFSFKIVGDIEPILNTLDLKKKLASRFEKTPKEYEEAIDLREKIHLQKNFKPSGSIENLKEGTYYLVSIDDKFRRIYEKK
ncbi:hypothetical protein PACTADRAFT_51624 [Pachysolen tannophilus NRRL Y-2460]|uniref:Hydroxymethylglutaryl-CoA synthase n=1 Tax=Pachysolen tannophilus NRRL Y-2460 TaxID=669874 RepID=A0A1E4TQ40_PACTA|nr:hypothetical protein PACTADRAFT_51624 [Pachysolen tannophilus NRRL Y-2460]